MGCEHRAKDEMSEAKGKMTMTGYLDCSECHEGVRHREAHQRPIQAGCPLNLANLIFDQDSGYRASRVHGADGGKVQSTAGLMAGCASAKDVLKIFVKPTNKRYRKKWRK